MHVHTMHRLHEHTHMHTHALTESNTTREGSPDICLPWSKPVRMREKVMKTRWALPRWVSSGVAAVRKPQAEADSRMTFSPPILEGPRGQ